MAKKKASAPAYRVPLFDRIFKPETITLANGHTVERPRSRTPLIAVAILAAIWASIQLTGFDILSFRFVRSQAGTQCHKEEVCHA